MVSHYQKPEIDTQHMVAFTKVKKQHLNALSSILWKLSGDRTLFKGAMQDALYQMWEKTDQLDGEEAEDVLYQIALSANQNAWRSQVTEPSQIGSLRPSNQPSREKERQRVTILIRWAISRLDPMQALVILWRYLEAKDDKTIAAAMGCTLEHAKRHVTDAVGALKAQLREAGQAHRLKTWNMYWNMTLLALDPTKELSKPA